MQKRWWWVFKILLTVVLLAVIFHRIPLTDIHQSFRDVEWSGIMWALLLVVPNLGVQLLRWRYLAHIADPHISGRSVITSWFSGFSVGMVTPGRIGELSRGLFLQDGPRALLTGLVIIEKMISLWALTLLGVAGFLYLRFTDHIFSVGLNNFFIGLASVLLIGIIVMIFDPNLLRRWVRRSSVVVQRLPFRDTLLSLLEASERYKKKHLPATFLFSMIFQIIIFEQLYLLVNAFDAAPVVECVAAGSAAMLVKSMMPFAVMDLGIREGALIFFMGNIGIPAASALNASLMLFVMNVLLPALAGYIFIVRRSLRRP